MQAWSGCASGRLPDLRIRRAAAPPSGSLFVSQPGKPFPALPRDCDGDDLRSPGAALAATHPPADSFKCCRRSAQARERFRLCDPLRSALAGDTDEEVAQRVVEILDVGEHAHGVHGADATPSASMQCGVARYTVRML